MAGFRIRAFHPLWKTFPGPSASLSCPTSGPCNPIPRAGWFRLFRFRSPLLTESLLISSPPGTEMFQFPGFASPAETGDDCVLPQPGFPIRKSPDQSLFSGSPKLIAAYRVLLRLSAPRHPPFALSSLTIPFQQGNRFKPKSRFLDLPLFGFQRTLITSRLFRRLGPSHDLTPHETSQTHR